MKAAMYYQGDPCLRIEEAPMPVPEPGEVLVQVAACGACHTDLHYLDHGVPTFKPSPMILGHEISGTIVALGFGVKKWQAGARVIIPAVLTCGECEACRMGKENICQQMVMLGNHINGGYAEYIAVPSKDLIPLPDSLPLADSSIIADALSTPFHAVVNRGRVRPGMTVAVFGCGGVGINVVQFAALCGARVIAVDLNDEKLACAKTLGASDTFNAGVADVDKAIRKATGGCDVSFEVIGKPEVMLKAMNVLKPGGTFVMVGYSAQDLSLPASRVMFREMEVRGSLGCRPVDYHRIVALVTQGRVQLAPLVTNRYPLDQVNQAFDDLREGKPVIRNIVVP